MFFENLLNRGATPGLVATLSYTGARHRMIAENIANMETPGYKARQLDAKAFQRTLGEAFDRRARDPRKPFVIKGREVRTDAAGSLKVTPSFKPADNVLFHDGTNLSLEREMADLAENAMMHQMTAELLRGRIDGLRKAIRGKV